MKLTEVYNTPLNEDMWTDPSIDLMPHDKEVELRIRNIQDTRIPTDRGQLGIMKALKNIDLNDKEKENLYKLLYPDDQALNNSMRKENRNAEYYERARNKMYELTLAYQAVMKSLLLEFVEDDKVALASLVADLQTGDTDMVRRKYNL